MAVSTIPDPYEKPYAMQKASPAATAPQNFPLRSVIEAHADVIAPLCPPGVSAETVIAQLWAVCQKVPQVAQATKESLVLAICQAVQTGGNIGSDVYLLPFRNKGVWEVSFAFDYKYLAACIVQAGGARSITAEVVRENDVFRVVKGSEPRIVHEEPTLGKERGKIIGFYAVAHLGASVPPKFFVMSLADVEKIRAKSKQWNPEKIGPVCPDWYGMARVVHRIGKLLPKRPNSRMQVIEQILDSDARVDAAEEIEGEITPIPERPATVDADGVDLSEDAEVSTELAEALAYRTKKGTALGDMTDGQIMDLRVWAENKGNTIVAGYCTLVLADRNSPAYHLDGEAA